MFPTLHKIKFNKFNFESHLFCRLQTLSIWAGSLVELNSFYLFLVTNGTLTFHYIMPNFYDPWKESFENIKGKGDNACYQNFSLFPQCFPTVSNIKPTIQAILKLLSAISHLVNTSPFPKQTLVFTCLH